MSCDNSNDVLFRLFTIRHSFCDMLLHLYSINECCKSILCRFAAAYACVLLRVVCFLSKYRYEGYDYRHLNRNCDFNNCFMRWLQRRLCLVFTQTLYGHSMIISNTGIKCCHCNLICFCDQVFPKMTTLSLAPFWSELNQQCYSFILFISVFWWSHRRI